MTTLFDPQKFIDREEEYAQFKKLLAFNSAAPRLLAIQDKGGMGKTNLMAKLYHHCKVAKPCYPVGLIRLNELDMDAYAPFLAVKKLVAELKQYPFNLTFPTFETRHAAYLKQDFTEINTLRARGEVNLSGANLSYASHIVATGTHFQAEQMTVYAPPTHLSPEQELVAQDACLEGFLTDLRVLCQHKPLVILFDACEKIPTHTPLYQWLMESLLIPYCLDVASRPPYLLVVLAGQTIPNFAAHWREEDCHDTICMVSSLRKWEREHVQKWLDAHGYSYQPHDVDSFYMGLQKGKSIAQIELVATNLLEKKAP